MRMSNLTAAFLLISFASAGAVMAKPSCAQIDSAISANEDFAEAALAGDKTAAGEALSAIHGEFAKIKPALAKPDAIETQIQLVEKAWTSGDAPLAALTAVEVYRLLITAFENRLPTSMDVAMLDYSGFRLHGLLAATPIDWNAVAATVAETNGNWLSAKSRVRDKGLSDLVGNVEMGVTNAAAARDSAWLHSGAQIQLDAVDLLERAVRNPAKGACK